VEHNYAASIFSGFPILAVEVDGYLDDDLEKRETLMVLGSLTQALWVVINRKGAY
jgi:hypothetical protein